MRPAAGGDYRKQMADGSCRPGPRWTWSLRQNTGVKRLGRIVAGEGRWSGIEPSGG